MTQKAVFLDSEGDAWISRNREILQERQLPESDPLLLEILDIPFGDTVRCLEIGCGDGTRLEWLARNRGWLCQGLDSSHDAVELCRKRGVEAFQGTADTLPFADQS